MRWLVSPPQASKDQNRFRNLFVRRLSRIFAAVGEAVFAPAAGWISGSQNDAPVSTSGAGADQHAQQRPGSRLPGNAHLPWMWPMVLHAVMQPRPLVHALQSTVAFSRALTYALDDDRRIATQRVTSILHSSALHVLSSVSSLSGLVLCVAFGPNLFFFLSSS